MTTTRYFVTATADELTTAADALTTTAGKIATNGDATTAAMLLRLADRMRACTTPDKIDIHRTPTDEKRMSDAQEAGDEDGWAMRPSRYSATDTSDEADVYRRAYRDAAADRASEILS